MQDTGIIGAIALIILFLFISFIVFIIKLVLDLKIYKKHKTYEPAERQLPPKQKTAPLPQKREEIMYLVEKPRQKRANNFSENEFTFVSPKKIYMIESEKVKK